MHDYTGPHDYFNEAYVNEWASIANTKRPFRCEFFDAFVNEGWWQSLPAPFDAIVSMQAIHEARDSARIPTLYGEFRPLLRVGGIILIADQVNDGDRQEEHLLNVGEHLAALSRAGFEEIRPVHAAGDLALFAATRRGKSVLRDPL